MGSLINVLLLVLQVQVVEKVLLRWLVQLLLQLHFQSRELPRQESYKV